MTTIGQYGPTAWTLSDGATPWAAFTPSADGVAAFSSNTGTVKVGGVTDPTLPQDAATKTGAPMINKRVSIFNNPFIAYFYKIIIKLTK